MLCSLRKDEASEVAADDDAHNRAAGIAADVLAIAAAGLFDSAWYCARYGMHLPAGREPLLHFCEIGWSLGLMPNAYFDTAFYLARNADVRAAGINPLRHYLQDGAGEGRWPGPHFDPLWYRETCNLPPEASALAHAVARSRQDEAAPNAGFDPHWYRARCAETCLPGATAFEDYLLQGAAQRRPTCEAYALIRDSDFFDPAFYVAHEPSLIADGLDPLYHFCAFGWRRRLSPHAAFDLAWYQDKYDDVRTASVNPLYHFLKFGRDEGRMPRAPDARRAASPEPQLEPAQALAASGLFDVNFYLVSYPDVRGSGQDPLAHFLAFGEAEGRRPNPYFDPAWYRAQYLAGEAGAAMSPLLHYATCGEARGHRPIVYFETEWYRRFYGLSDEQSPLLHYLTHRRSQRFSPISCFDLFFYLQNWGTEIGANRDAFAHFLRAGIERDIDPSPAFDLARYRRQAMAGPAPPARPQPGAEFLSKIEREAYNPLVHFLLQANGPERAATSAAA